MIMTESHTPSIVSNDTPFPADQRHQVIIPTATPSSEAANTCEVEVMKFFVVQNDDVEDSMIKLLQAKDCFAKQLPKMPKDYIVRLVFDRNHRTFMMTRKSEMVGGCCFRPFPERHFAEIVFLAVTATEQVKGYGTKLMSSLKEHCKNVGINYLLTYADNFATGYFKKQGFTEHINLPKDVWSGFIKDYDGGQLMGCPVYGHIDYRDMSMSFEDHIRETLGHFVRRGSWQAAQYDIEKFRKNNPTLVPKLTLKSQIASVIEKSIKNNSSWPFREPVNINIVKNYPNIVQSPIDLRTMLEKNNSDLYTSKADFEADVNLMFDNCLKFNGPNHEISKRAEELNEFIKPRLRAIVEYDLGISRSL